MRYLDLAQELIRIPTINGNTQAFDEAWQLLDSQLVDFKYKRYMSNGYQSRVYYAGSSLPDHFDVLLNPHLDVVPGNASVFNPVIKDSKLFGRGAYDMKAALAIYLDAFIRLAPASKLKIGLQIVTDEEQGGHNGTKYQFEQGLKTNFGISGECNSNFDIKNKAKGIAWYKITFHGKNSHSSRPWNGSNAIYQVAHFLSELEHQIPTPSTEVWETTISPSKITTTNTAMNQVPNQATMSLDCRYVPGDKARVDGIIERILPPNAVIETLLSDGEHDTADDHPYVQGLMQEAQKYTHSKLAKSHGTGDMRFYTLNGSNGVEFGPIGGNEHNDDEWVSLDSLEKYAQVIETWLGTIQPL